jgi:Flp pilus assembly protein TadB
MTDGLKKTIENEINILREISSFSLRLGSSSPGEQMMLAEGINALRKEMKAVNSTIPEQLNDIMPQIRETPGAKAERIEKPAEASTLPEPRNIVQKIDREDYLKQLEISGALLKKLKRKREADEEKVEEFQKARGYLRWSNRLFLGAATKLAKKGYLGNLPVELKKSNLDMLFESYVAMMMLSVFISFFAAILVAIVLLLAGVGALKVIWLPLVVPIGVFLAMDYYPSAERKSISNRIEEELPFAVIHMSSISGSGIEPTEIFKIIGLSRDYPFLKKEIRKVLNQINVYGYDLVTALNNVSKNTASAKLAELFAGLSTTINSGGGLSEFFQKRADTLLLGYKLEKEKSIKVAETFMDIYISVVIAAPMILMLMLVMISISGIQIGFTPYQLTFATIGGVALVNMVFLGYLQTKQT